MRHKLLLPCLILSLSGCGTSGTPTSPQVTQRIWKFSLPVASLQSQSWQEIYFNSDETQITKIRWWGDGSEDKAIVIEAGGTCKNGNNTFSIAKADVKNGSNGWKKAIVTIRLTSEVNGKNIILPFLSFIMERNDNSTTARVTETRDDSSDLSFPDERTGVDKMAIATFVNPSSENAQGTPIPNPSAQSQSKYDGMSVQDLAAEIQSNLISSQGVRAEAAWRDTYLKIESGQGTIGKAIMENSGLLDDVSGECRIAVRVLYVKLGGHLTPEEIKTAKDQRKAEAETAEIVAKQRADQEIKEKAQREAEAIKKEAASFQLEQENEEKRKKLTEQAKPIIEEARRLEAADDLVAAVKKYYSALEIINNEEVKKHITTLKSLIQERADAQRKAEQEADQKREVEALLANFDGLIKDKKYVQARSLAQQIYALAPKHAKLMQIREGLRGEPFDSSEHFTVQTLRNSSVFITGCHVSMIAETKQVDLTFNQDDRKFVVEGTNAASEKFGNEFLGVFRLPGDAECKCYWVSDFFSSQISDQGKPYLDRPIHLFENIFESGGYWHSLRDGKTVKTIAANTPDAQQLELPKPNFETTFLGKESGSVAKIANGSEGLFVLNIALQPKPHLLKRVSIPSSKIPGGYCPFALYDIKKNGQQDLIYMTSGKQVAIVHWEDGDVKRLWTSEKIDERVNGIGVGDLNSDGRIDLILCCGEPRDGNGYIRIITPDWKAIKEK